MDEPNHPGFRAFVMLFVLSFLMNSLLTLSNTYSDALFLSTYPSQWLTWYYLAIPVVTIFLYLFITPYLSKTLPHQSFFFILAMTGTFLVSYHLMATKIYATPFILCVLLSISGKLVYIMGWSAIASSLDIRVFKHHVFHLNTIGNIGQISICFLTPGIIHFFHNSGVFYANIIAYVLTAGCILVLKPLPAGTAKPQHQLDDNLNKNYFFKVLFVLTIITVIIDTLVNVSFRAVLIGHFTQDGLATFLSLFNGCISVAGVITELIIAERVLFWIGISGILLLTPLVCVLFGTIAALWPSFIFMLALRGAQTFFKNNFATPFMQVILCPYPSALRKKVSLYLSGYATPLGGIIGASLIFMIDAWLDPHFFGFVVAMASLCWIIMNNKVRYGYQDMLYASLKENRYNPDVLNIPAESILFMREDILHALSSPDVCVVKTALDFFDQPLVSQHLRDGELQKAISLKLSNTDPDVRYKAALALKRLKATSATDSLLKQLHIEENTSVGWAIVDALFHLNVLPESPAIQSYLQSPQPFHIAYGLIALDHAPSPSLQKKSQDELQHLLKGSIKDKLLLARTENYLQSSPKHNHQLEALMQDPSDEVSIQAIRAVTIDSSIDFTPLLLKFLNAKNKSWYAEKALSKFQDKILDQLLTVNLKAPKRQQLSMVRLLSKPRALPALNKLIELSQSTHVSLRLFIARSVLHHSSYDPKQDMFSNPIITMVEWLAEEIYCLLQLDAKSNEAIQREIDVQLYINRCVFIVWFSLATDKNRVSAVAHYIENPTHYNSIDLAKAYELLDSLSTHVKLRYAIKRISEDYQPSQVINKQTAGINPGILLLAEHPFKYQEKTPMNTMDKTALLRRVKLFESIPVESLQAIAEICQERDMAAGEYIFKEKEETDHFYCIVSGKVAIKRGEHLLSELQEADYFGELGVLDGMPRTADAIASHNGALLYIEREEFLNVLEDLPDIMRAVVGQIIRYLRQNLKESF